MPEVTMTLRAAWLWLVVMVAGCASTGGLDGPPPSDVRGTWEGQILVPGSPVIVTVRLDGPPRGTMDVRHRPLRDVPVRLVSSPGSTEFLLVSELPGARVSFHGERRGTDIRGVFREQGRSYPFWLTRTRA
jgi:hypothetical protein